MYAPLVILKSCTARLVALLCSVACKCRMLKEVHLGGSVQELRAENVHIKHELWALHQRLSSSDAEVGQLVAKAHGMESEVCSLTRYKSTARTGVTFS